MNSDCTSSKYSEELKFTCLFAEPLLARLKVAVFLKAVSQNNRDEKNCRISRQAALACSHWSRYLQFGWWYSSFYLFFFYQITNVIFTEHAINNADSNLNLKLKRKCYSRAKQELYLTIYCNKESKVK